MTNQQSIDCILNELKAAKKEHPTFPTDIVHQVAIMVEEAGEAIQAALEHYEENGDLKKVEHELFQTGAMVLRCLENLQDCREIKNGVPVIVKTCVWVYYYSGNMYSTSCGKHYNKGDYSNYGAYKCPSCNNIVELI